MGWNTYMLNKKVSGCVGKDAGIKYFSYYEHYMELLPMVQNIYLGKNVSNEYNKLAPSKQIVACMITCARLAAQLDEVKDIKNLPPSINHVGKFLADVTYENVLVAVRSQVQIDRLVRFNLDEHPDWSIVLSRINKEVDQ
jgi:hypothetical protein